MHLRTEFGCDKLYRHRPTLGKSREDHCCFGLFLGLDGLTKHQKIPIRSQHHEFPLSIKLIDGAMHIACGKRIEFRLQLHKQCIHIANVNVIREAPVTGRRPIGPMLFQDAKADSLAVHIRVIAAMAMQDGKAQNIDKEMQRPFQVPDHQKRRHLHKVAGSGL